MKTPLNKKLTDNSVIKDLNQSQFKNKYKALINSLLILLVGLVAIIALNFYLSKANTTATEQLDLIGDVSDSTLHIALSSQRLALVGDSNPQLAQELTNELKDDASELDKQLAELSQYDKKDEDIMDNVAKIWTPYRQKIAGLSSNQQAQRIDLANYAFEQKDPIWKAIDQSYNAYLDETYKLASYIRYLQIFTFLALVAYLLFFVNYTFRRMRALDAGIEKAQQQTDDILRTVNEGLFLIDKDMVIGEQYSAKLEPLLNQHKIAGRNLLDLLSGTISPSDMETTKLFVEQLYNSWVVEDLIQDLNPLKQVLFSFVDNKGISETKFLSFEFLRVLDAQDNVDKVFVSVVDVTNEIRLQKQIQLDKEQHDRQIEMISFLISADISQLQHFIEQTKQRIQRMNNVLKIDNNQDYPAKVNQLFRDTHSLKGDASAIRLEAVVNLAQRQEAILKKLQQQSQLQGNDFLGFTIGLNELLEMIDFIEQLTNKMNFSQLRELNAQPQVILPQADTSLANEISSDVVVTSNVQALEPTTAVTNLTAENDQNVEQPNAYWEKFFSQYAQTIAERQGKLVDVTVTGFDKSTANETQMANFADITVQLLKNAIVHGIETPEQRTAQGKESKGYVLLDLQEDATHRILTVRDDGHGIDWDKIRQKAIDMDKLTAAQASQLEPRQLVGLLFTPGVTTATQLDEDAGQGVGMDIVRQLATDEQGSLSLKSQLNEFTQFVIRFPKL